MWVQSPGREDLLKEGMTTPSSILAWRIPWTEEPGGLESLGSQSRTRLSMHRPVSSLEALALGFHGKVILPCNSTRLCLLVFFSPNKIRIFMA